MPDFVRIYDVLHSVAVRNRTMTLEQDFELQKLTSGFGQGAISITAPANVNIPDPKMVVSKKFGENTNSIYGYSEEELVVIAAAKAEPETKVVVVNFGATRDDVVTDDPILSGRHVIMPLSDSDGSNIIRVDFREHLKYTG